MHTTTIFKYKTVNKEWAPIFFFFFIIKFNLYSHFAYLFLSTCINICFGIKILISASKKEKKKTQIPATIFVYILVLFCSLFRKSTSSLSNNNKKLTMKTPKINEERNLFNKNYKDMTKSNIDNNNNNVQTVTY